MEETIKENGYNLHLIKTNRFKTIHTTVVFSEVVNRKDYYIKHLLLDMLTENNSEVKTRRELAIKTEELYGVNIYSESVRDGALARYEVAVNFLNPKYLEEDITDSIYDLLFTCILKPKLENNMFDEETFNQRKKYFVDMLKKEQEDPRIIAKRHSSKLVDEETVIGLDIYGELEDVLSIKLEDLYDAYQSLLNDTNIDIIVIGDINKNSIKTSISKYALFNKRDNSLLSPYIYPKVRTKIIDKKETSKDTQSIVILYYVLDDTVTDYERKYVLNVFDEVLGSGGLQSKLYRCLREEHSLCYSVGSSYGRLSSNIRIGTNVSKENIDKALSLIKETFNSMKDSVTDEEVEIAKASIFKGLIQSRDFINSIYGSTYNEYLNDLDPYEERLKNYKKVTKEEVMNITNKLHLSVSYVLEGCGDNEEN